MIATLIFVLPDDQDLISGGNLYNHSLLAALRPRVQHLEVVTAASAVRLLGQYPDAVVVVDSAILEVTPLLSAVSNGAILLLAHHLPSFEPSQDDAVRQREDELLQGATGFIATSTFTRDVLQERFSHRLPVLTVPPALAVPPRGEPRPRASHLRCLLVGNVIRRKGLLRLLDALAGRLRPTDDLSLHVIGGGTLEPNYWRTCSERIAATPSLRSRVEMVGEVAPERMPSWYAPGTVFISAAEVETYGMALAEARAFGLLILALKGGHVATHVPTPDHGQLFESVTALATELVRLARSPTLLQQRVGRAEQVRQLDDYTWHDAAESLLAQMQSLLGPNATAVR